MNNNVRSGDTGGGSGFLKAGMGVCVVIFILALIFGSLSRNFSSWLIGLAFLAGAVLLWIVDMMFASHPRV